MFHDRQLANVQDAAEGGITMERTRESMIHQFGIGAFAVLVNWPWLCSVDRSGFTFSYRPSLKADPPAALLRDIHVI